LESAHSPAAITRFALTTFIGLGIDLWTKSLAAAHLAGGRGVRFIPGWLHFEYTENRGAVFGIAQGQRWLFVIVSIGAIVFLSWLFAVSRRRQWFYQILLGMLLAGVLGNMYDRVVYGYVRDMILMLPGWHWSGSWMLPLVHYPGVTRDVFPWIFNVADSLLCTGVGLMIIYNFLQPSGNIEDVNKERHEGTEARRDEG
jgi:signal peptidase II